MTALTTEQVLRLHNDLVRTFGGSAGVRDANLLDAAVQSPFQSYGGEELFPSIPQKAARLGFGLIKNHPFVDGNKRVGAHVMLVFLALNGISPRFEQRELIDVILAVASGEAGFEELLTWILDHGA